MKQKKEQHIFYWLDPFFYIYFYLCAVTSTICTNTMIVQYCYSRVAKLWNGTSSFCGSETSKLLFALSRNYRHSAWQSVLSLMVIVVLFGSPSTVPVGIWRSNSNFSGHSKAG